MLHVSRAKFYDEVRWTYESNPSSVLTSDQYRKRLTTVAESDNDCVDDWLFKNVDSHNVELNTPR